MPSILFHMPAGSIEWSKTRRTGTKVQVADLVKYLAGRRGTASRDKVVICMAWRDIVQQFRIHRSRSRYPNSTNGSSTKHEPAMFGVQSWAGL